MAWAPGPAGFPTAAHSLGADAAWSSGGDPPDLEMPRRQERASLPVRGCPRTELQALRQEAWRLREEARLASLQQREVEVLKAELRQILNENRTMTDELEERKRLHAKHVKAADEREQAARRAARHSKLESARQLFRCMLAVGDERGSENVPPKELSATKSRESLSCATGPNPQRHEGMRGR
eukprot:TRINITY_DN37092_c0_g1_i1.p1 TRINITY_DN37092_c0_g1~~TRINITY_DN37092_c0_g1_i1.p1  ORF type:complete len:182 (+),score=43.92 TRINITY_DN37092_c0_g1_i1:49-594(+)